MNPMKLPVTIQPTGHVFPRWQAIITTSGTHLNVRRTVTNPGPNGCDTAIIVTGHQPSELRALARALDRAADMLDTHQQETA
nr:MAG: hypothetical protein DIU74_13055 [Pseudomonadota bacterium]